MRWLRGMAVVAVLAGGVAAYGQLGGDEPGSKPETPQPQSKPVGPVRIASGVVAGLKLGGPPPVYPAVARAKHISGTVMMHAIITKDGHINNLAVISGPEELREAASSAVSQWTYRPYMLNGEPAEVDTTIIVNFNLGSSPQSGQVPAAPALISGGVLGGIVSKGDVAIEPGGTQTRPVGPVRISSGVMAGLLKTKVNPSYPEEARRNHVQGAVILHAIIGKDGHVAKLTAIAGPEELRDAAIDAVNQWTYKVYLLNGEPQEVETTVILNFNLTGG